MDKSWELNVNEARVLGVLLEKQITTPEYYPLSLNALVNGCNQKSNREPVMALDEEAVRLALRNLQDKGLAAVGHEARVAKFEHRLQEVFNLSRGQTALLCVLLLRGAQTPGELRGRSERLHAFAELDEITGVLQQLMDHHPPLAAILPRHPGTKESRYIHLLAPVPQASLPPTAAVAAPAAPPPPEWEQRMQRLEAEVTALRAAVRELRGGD